MELWLLTAFLFSLLIVGRLTAHNATSAQLTQLPAGTTLLRNITPAPPAGTPDSPFPLFQPTAFYSSALTSAAQ